MKTLLFAYGSLRHNEDPPKTLESWEPATAQLALYRIPGYKWAAATHGQATVQGELLIIDTEDFPALDDREDQAEHRRERITVRYGQYRTTKAWVYIYIKPIPNNAMQLTEWSK